MDIKKLIDNLAKEDANTFARICTSIREVLKNENENLTKSDNIGIVSELNTILGAKTPDEQKEILTNIAAIFSNYDSETYSTYEIEKKLLEIIDMKNPLEHDDHTK